MNQTPKIRDTDGLGSDCCPRPGGLKELHKIPRTLPKVLVQNPPTDFLQDEDSFPILDEETANLIFDDLRF